MFTVRFVVRNVSGEIDMKKWKAKGKGIRKNLEDVKSDLRSKDYLDMKFPILYHEKTDEFAVCFNKSEVSIHDMSKNETKYYIKFLKGFQDPETAGKFWDRVTLDYFGGGY